MRSRPPRVRFSFVLYGQTLGTRLLDIERDLHLDTDILQSVRYRNAAAVPLPVYFSDARVVVVAPSVVEGLWQSDSAVGANPQFAAMFPKALGVYSFHLPGYAQNGRRALVHYMWTAGPLAAESFWVGLTKHGDTWIVEWQTIDWAS